MFYRWKQKNLSIIIIIIIIVNWKKCTLRNINFQQVPCFSCARQHLLIWCHYHRSLKLFIEKTSNIFKTHKSHSLFLYTNWWEKMILEILGHFIFFLSLILLISFLFLLHNFLMMSLTLTSGIGDLNYFYHFNIKFPYKTLTFEDKCISI